MKYMKVRAPSQLYAVLVKTVNAFFSKCFFFQMADRLSPELPNRF